MTIFCVFFGVGLACAGILTDDLPAVLGGLLMLHMGTLLDHLDTRRTLLEIEQRRISTLKAALGRSRVGDDDDAR